MTLNESKIGQQYIIHSLKENECTVKLVEMGFLRNRVVNIISNIWDNNTLCVSIGDSRIMLRKNESETVIVRECEYKDS